MAQKLMKREATLSHFICCSSEKCRFLSRLINWVNCESLHSSGHWMYCSTCSKLSNTRKKLAVFDFFLEPPSRGLSSTYPTRLVAQADSNSSTPKPSRLKQLGSKYKPSRLSRLGQAVAMSKDVATTTVYAANNSTYRNLPSKVKILPDLRTAT